MTHPAEPGPPVDRSRIQTNSEDSLDAEQTLELREEQLVVNKELRDRGEVIIRTVVEEAPGRLEADAFSEEVEIVHEPAGEAVSERRAPWHEDDTLVVPVYEEQLVVVKRLVLKERLRIRRVGTTERRLFEDTLRRERVVVDDPQHTGLIHEVFPTDDDSQPTTKQDQPSSGVLEHLVRKALE